MLFLLWCTVINRGVVDVLVQAQVPHGDCQPDRALWFLDMIMCGIKGL